MTTLELQALEIQQPSGQRLYLFGVDGKLVHRFAAVSRVKRVDGALSGYQRPEVSAHIDTIRSYLESSGALLPNAVVLAFDGRVSFAPAAATSNGSTPGVLSIPLPDEGTQGAELPGFIIDGQQRLAAVREANVPAFPLAVCAFITDSVGMQAEHFIRVNTTKPLRRSLITELLPSTTGELPPALFRRKMPAVLLERLNQDEDSPLKGLIITSTNPKRTGKTPAKWAGLTGLIADNSVLRALEYSLNDGVLYDLLEGEDGQASALALVKRWWSVVRDTFPEAWGKDPSESRLFHGAGVVAMGLLLDSICSLTRTTHPSPTELRAELALVAPDCRWTEGVWDFGPRLKLEWRELQNTTRHVEMLSSHLFNLYRARRQALAEDGVALPAVRASRKRTRSA